MPEISIDEVHRIVGELYVRNKMLEGLLNEATARLSAYQTREAEGELSQEGSNQHEHEDAPSGAEEPAGAQPAPADADAGSPEALSTLRAWRK